MFHYTRGIARYPLNVKDGELCSRGSLLPICLHPLISSLHETERKQDENETCETLVNPSSSNVTFLYILRTPSFEVQIFRGYKNKKMGENGLIIHVRVRIRG